MESWIFRCYRYKQITFWTIIKFTWAAFVLNAHRSDDEVFGAFCLDLETEYPDMGHYVGCTHQAGGEGGVWLSQIQGTHTDQVRNLT